MSLKSAPVLSLFARTGAVERPASPAWPSPPLDAPRRPWTGPAAVYAPAQTRHYDSERRLRKEAKEMPKGKQFVFSARTTEEGLKTLAGLKARLACSWDDLVIDAVNAHHGVNVPKVPKAGPTAAERAAAKAAREAGKKAKADARAEAAKARAKAKAEKAAADKKAKAAKAKAKKSKAEKPEAEKPEAGEVRVYDAETKRLKRTETAKGETVSAAKAED